MRKTFTIDVAHPASVVTSLAQKAGDRVPKWRGDGQLRWKYGSHAGLKAPGKAMVSIEPKGDRASMVTVELRRFGLFDLFGILKNDYRDFYDAFEPLIRAQTQAAGTES